MLNNRQLGNSKSEETTIISKGVKIEGKITSSGNIRIDGEIQGDIFTKNLVIEEGAKFDGKCKTGDSIDIGESQETTKPSTTITR